MKFTQETNKLIIEFEKGDIILERNFARNRFEGILNELRLYNIKAERQIVIRDELPENKIQEQIKESVKEPKGDSQ